MPLKYKFDILAALREKGYRSPRLRNEKILSESTMQKFRTGEMVSTDNIGRLCELLDCQPGDILEYISDKKITGVNHLTYTPPLEGQAGGDIMPMKYKFNILAALKEKGYNSTKLRNEKIFGESTMQKFRTGEMVSADNIGRLCKLLNCQPGDILEYIPDED